MQFHLVVVGKPRDANLAGAIHEYETRAARYWPLHISEVREEPARGGASSADLVRER
jgi:23S rRNA (pseudouridine1915-N3)-methyltransferase